MKKSLWAMLASCMAVVFLVAGGMVASASTSGKHCVIVLKKVEANSPNTVVTYRECAATGQMAASLVPQTTWMLITFFKHSGQSGKESFTVYGESGPCDSAGYGMESLYHENSAIDGISSFQTYSQCNGQAIYFGQHFNNLCRHMTGWKNNVPYDCNDHVWSARVYKSYY